MSTGFLRNYWLDFNETPWVDAYIACMFWFDFFSNGNVLLMNSALHMAYVFNALR